jgi:SAM-dependent methyltransferase
MTPATATTQTPTAAAVSAPAAAKPTSAKRAAEIAETIYRLDGPLRWTLGENETLADLAAIGGGARVLDLGAGTGYLSLPLARRVGPAGRVEAVDLCPQLLDHLLVKAGREGLAERITPHVAAAQSLPFEDGVFDAAVSSYLLHELAEEAPAMLAELARVLKPGGRLVVADFRRIEDDARRREIEAWYGAQPDGDDDGDQHLRFSLGDLERLLIGAGFRDLRLATWAEFHMHAVARR